MGSHAAQPGWRRPLPLNIQTLKLELIQLSSDLSLTRNECSFGHSRERHLIDVVLTEGGGVPCFAILAWTYGKGWP
jgi:hypothetical protein